MTWVSSAGAAVVAYDGFESYSPGANLHNGSGGTDWTNNWTTEGDHTTVQTQVLVDPNGNITTGDQAARLQPTAHLADVSSFMQRNFPATSDTLYMSLLIRKGSTFDGQDFINFQVSNGATGNSSSAMGVGIRNQAGDPFFARVGSSSNATTNYSSVAADTDYLLVAKFSKDGSSTFNRTDLFVNPTSFVEPVTPNATATFGGTGLSSLSLFSVRHFQPEQGDTVFIDELRLATTFADAMGESTVIPTPTTFAMVLPLMIGLVTRRHRQKTA